MLDFIGEMGLKNWVSLGQVVKNITEEQAQAMIDHELATKRRTTFVVRLHQKLTALRAERERAELVKQCELREDD